MKFGEIDFDQEDRDRAAQLEKEQRKAEKKATKRRAHTVFLIGGLCLKLCAVVFSIITLIVHGDGRATVSQQLIRASGGKFEAQGIVSTDGRHHRDGPGVDYLVALYIMTVFAVFSLLTNAVGPCSINERGHFAGSLLFLANDVSYAAVAKTVLDLWPSDAGGWSPFPWLLSTMGGMVVSGFVMAVSAHQISGTGCTPKKVKEVKCVSMRAFGELQEGELQDVEDKVEVATTAYSRYKEHKKQKKQREQKQQRERLLSDAHPDRGTQESSVV